MILSMHQPSYFPWLGLLDKIRQSDVFLVMDEVQLSDSAYQHRNLLLSADGTPKFLTIPFVKKNYLQKPIKALEIASPQWRIQHLNFIRNTYRNHRHAAEIMPRVEEFYAAEYRLLADAVIASMRLALGVLRYPYTGDFAEHSRLRSFPPARRSGRGPGARAGSAVLPVGTGCPRLSRRVRASRRTWRFATTTLSIRFIPSAEASSSRRDWRVWMRGTIWGRKPPEHCLTANGRRTRAARMINHSASQVLGADFDYVQRIIDSNFVGEGPLCAELEALLAARFARSQVTLTHSGAAALHLCLSAMAVRQPKKTRVLVCAYVCPQVVSAVTQAGIEPVFIDCRSDSLNANMEAAGRAVDGRTLAVICANTGGMPDDYAAAAALGIPVVSDCAQAVGARIRGSGGGGLGNLLHSLLRSHQDAYRRRRRPPRSSGDAEIRRRHCEDGASGVVGGRVSPRGVSSYLRPAYGRTHGWPGAGAASQAGCHGGAAPCHCRRLRPRPQ